MTMLVLRKADGRLKLLGCRQIPPVQPEVVHNTMRWSFDASTFNMAGTRRNVADIELALPTTGTEEQSPNDDEVEQSFACLIQVHQLPLHDYWQIDRWRWDELCNAAAGGPAGDAAEAIMAALQQGAETVGELHAAWRLEAVREAMLTALCDLLGPSPCSLLSPSSPPSSISCAGKPGWMSSTL